MIVIQEIKVRWSKESRSGAAAAQRQATPSAWALPERPLGSFGLHQELVFEESCHFQFTQARVLDITDEHRHYLAGCVQVHREPPVVIVMYCYYEEAGGAPERTHHPRQVLQLNVGEWGRVIYNGRFTNSRPTGGAWLYQQVTVNIAHLQHYEPQTFLDGQPVKVFTDLAKLL